MNHKRRQKCLFCGASFSSDRSRKFCLRKRYLSYRFGEVSYKYDTYRKNGKHEAMRCVFKSLLNEKIIDESQYKLCIKKATDELAPEVFCHLVGRIEIGGKGDARLVFKGYNLKPIYSDEKYKSSNRRMVSLKIL